ncbi:hypothetical protein [Microbacterium dauci]|uniref:Uncharacterized protein n=1 Tax=Microbacterium dauci TaxID=3048008 RepID=A0ABT6ZHE9_9MICO|nr:hypothetical protein [Microbacterium sp. LX3-4]MDJ1115381.1 hypothetical protein [Microbacterium sp. LX3-4]
MSYQDRVTFHCFDILVALQSDDDEAHTAADERLKASDVHPVHVAVKFAGMVEASIPAERRAAWHKYIVDQLEAARLLAAADLPPEKDDPLGP